MPLTPRFLTACHERRSAVRWTFTETRVPSGAAAMTGKVKSSPTLAKELVSPSPR